MFKTVDYIDGTLRVLDQRRLPLEEVYLDCPDLGSAAMAIKEMAVRGAPAIGIAAAFAVAQEARKIKAEEMDRFLKELDEICRLLASTRPTAVNLFWAIRRMKRVTENNRSLPVEKVKRLLEAEARRMLEEDIEANVAMGRHGERVIKDGDTVLTHCNAGALATGGFGTALGVIRAAWANRKKIRVYADETRPLLQGARLTAWELSKENIPVTIITDNAAGFLMSRGEIDLVIVGADRVAANGDAANKIGTYSLAVLAVEHGIPFYVAAPTSTIDISIPSGESIPIEERSPLEVTQINGRWIAPQGVRAINLAFDVTPNRLISGIITEKGMLEQPFEKAIARLMEGPMKP